MTNAGSASTRIDSGANQSERYRINPIRYCLGVLCLLASVLAPAGAASAQQAEEVPQITAVVGEYFDFYLASVTDDACRQGAPDWPQVTGLPAGMYRGGCTIYGYPEMAGVSTLEFPTIGGVFVVELTVTDGSGGGADDDSGEDVPQVNAVLGQYTGFYLSSISDADCRQGAPDWPRVTGLPEGMYESGCIIYGYPQALGTSRLEFPVADGVFAIDFVVTDGSTDDDGDTDDGDTDDGDTDGRDTDDGDNDDGDTDGGDTGGVVTVCEPSTSGTDYPVGPGQTYANIADVPWNTLGAGDTVRIFHRDTPYHEKVIISTNGTEQAPITVCGVAGPNGERPILDGDGASNSSTDADAFGTYAPMEGLAMVMIYNRSYTEKVHNIVIDGLHIRNAKDTFSYTRMDGSTDQYERGSACVRVQAGDNIVIRNSELENCGNGVFTMSQAYNEASLTRNILIEGNYLHGHGQAGSYLEHGMYIQAIGATYQYNRFGPNAQGAQGSTLKERVAGSVIRYNWFDAGSARILDIVEVQDAAPWYLEQSYRDSAAANGEAIDPDRLARVQEAEAAYRNTHVYGNFFKHVGSETGAANLIHYGFDNDSTLSHKGTLHFYNNTMSIENDQSDAWRIRIFDVYANDENALIPADETIEVFNNIIYFDSETAGAAPSYICFGRASGTINLGVNWVSDNLNDPAAVSGCAMNNGMAPTINGLENLIDTSGEATPINTNTLAPVDLASIRGQAQAASAATASNPVTQQYVRHQNSTGRATSNDLGATEFPG